MEEKYKYNMLDDRHELWVGYYYRFDGISKVGYLGELLERFGFEDAISAAEYWIKWYPDDEEADEMRKFIEEMKNNLSNTEQRP